MTTYLLIAMLLAAIAAACLFGVVAILLFAQVAWILAWATGKAWARIKRGSR